MKFILKNVFECHWYILPTISHKSTKDKMSVQEIRGNIIDS